MVIRKLPGRRKWRIYSQETYRILGTFPTKTQALQREKQIRFFKWKNKQK